MQNSQKGRKNYFEKQINIYDSILGKFESSTRLQKNNRDEQMVGNAIHIRFVMIESSICKYYLYHISAFSLCICPARFQSFQHPIKNIKFTITLQTKVAFFFSKDGNK